MTAIRRIVLAARILRSAILIGISKRRGKKWPEVLCDGFLPQTVFKLWTDFLKLCCAVINLPTMSADALPADALLSPA
jgi:hypothetical protein